MTHSPIGGGSSLAYQLAIEQNFYSRKTVESATTAWTAPAGPYHDARKRFDAPGS